MIDKAICFVHLPRSTRTVSCRGFVRTRGNSLEACQDCQELIETEVQGSNGPLLRSNAWEKHSIGSDQLQGFSRGAYWSVSLRSCGITVFTTSLNGAVTANCWLEIRTALRIVYEQCVVQEGTGGTIHESHDARLRKSVAIGEARLQKAFLNSIVSLKKIIFKSQPPGAAGSSQRATWYCETAFATPATATF